MSQWSRRLSATEPMLRADVCLIVHNAVGDDPRVRKQGNLLHAMGLEVAAVGLPGASSPPPPWPVLETHAPGSRASRARAVADLAAYAIMRIVQPAARLSPGLAEAVYWRRDGHAALYQRARAVKAAVYVANDWQTMAIADRLARENGGIWVYDSHEYAAQELPESWRWRVFMQGLVVNIERRYISRAKLVSTVSRGIAHCLAADHALRNAVLVVRNVPEHDCREPVYSMKRGDGRIRLLYHGAITPFRGLHEIVESVRFWRPGRELVLRGPMSASYREHLDGIIARRSLADRVSILPAVKPAELIACASACDVGIVSLPDTSRQNAFALPNKVFEYMKAGLALMVPDLAELAGLVRGEGNGFVFRRLEPQAIAEAVNELDEASIEACKARSRAIAPKLTWEAEAAYWASRIAEMTGQAAGTDRAHAHRK